MSASPFLGVDVGGTFTDVVLSDADGRIHTGKVLTTPDDPRDGTCRGIREVLEATGTAAADISRLVHGTTLATNVILERKGPPVALVTTAGFGAMLRLGREARVEGDRYDLLFETMVPPVPPELTFEVTERVAGSGETLTKLTAEEIDDLVARVRAAAPTSIAVCLINSHLDPRHEQAIGAALRRALPEAYLTVSSDVWPEPREYDRAMTTVISAYVGPIMTDYLHGLERRVQELGIECPVEIMESSGGVLRAALAAERPVYTVESGGAAGVIAAGHVGGLLGEDEVISFDMGGTTAKAGVVREGRPDITHDFQVGGKGSFGSTRSGTGFPVKTPVVDMAEVGAGGGSIAWVDAGGALRVGPTSAGSDPGPVCYGRGGTSPTVTDANLVLGYLDPGALADGLELDTDAARRSIEALVAPLGLDAVSGAWAIHDLVTTNMAGAIHVVTVQRGIDPRSFTIVGFGGAGPLHVARLASAFRIPRAAVPWAAGVTAAIGLCTADLTVHHVRSHVTDAATADGAELTAMFEELEARGREDLADARADSAFAVDRSVGVRYRGQAYQLTVPAPSGPLDADALAAITTSFRALYHQTYGIDLAAPVQIVSLHARVRRLVDKLSMAEVESTGTDPEESRLDTRPTYAHGRGMVDTPVYDWAGLSPGTALPGPALVQGPDTTVVVPDGFRLTIDAFRNVLLDADVVATGVGRSG
jgi:N-methylhydantoinase A